MANFSVCYIGAEKYWYTLSYKEIAQTLGTAVSAIKSKLFQARRMMTTQRIAAQMVTY